MFDYVTKSDCRRASEGPSGSRPWLCCVFGAGWGILPCFWRHGHRSYEHHLGHIAGSRRTEQKPGQKRNPSLDRAAARIPPENIVVSGCLAARSFHEGEAGQQAPVQSVHVGGFQEYRREFGGGTIALREEGAQEGEPGIFGGFVAMFGGGWLRGIRLGSGYRQGTHTGKNGQTVRKQFSHIEITSFLRFGFLKNRPNQRPRKYRVEGAKARISGVCLLQA